MAQCAHVTLILTRLCWQVCVYGQSTKNNLIALVIPDEVAAKKWAAKNGVAEDSMEELVRNKEFRKEILDQVA